MEAKKLKELKKGEFFTLKPIEYPKDNQVFLRDDYDRESRKYWGQKFSDISDGRLFPGDKIVYVDFIF